MKTKYDDGDTLFRHGDVLLRKTSNGLRSTEKPLSHAVLHRGQSHDHALIGDFYLRDEEGKQFLGILAPSRLDHTEHGEIPISPEDVGHMELEVARQREYDHWDEESRQVID